MDFLVCLLAMIEVNESGVGVLISAVLLMCR